MNLKNTKTMQIPVYTDEEIADMLSEEDLEEFLRLIGYFEKGEK